MTMTKNDYMVMVGIKITLSEAHALAILGRAYDPDSKRPICDALEQIAGYMESGVCRPGSWERPVAVSMFNEEKWSKFLEPDPDFPHRLRVTKVAQETPDQVIQMRNILFEIEDENV